MHQDRPQARVSRRALLGSAAAGLITMSSGSHVSAAASPATPTKSTIVRDRLWLFSVYPGGRQQFLGIGRSARRFAHDAG